MAKQPKPDRGGEQSAPPLVVLWKMLSLLCETGNGIIWLSRTVYSKNIQFVNIPMTINMTVVNIACREVYIMVNVSELAKYLLYLNKQEAESDGDEAASDMTPMKLQKLLYYCQGYSLGLTGRPLFNDSIEGWHYGPVVRSVYKEYKDFKGQCLPLDLAPCMPKVDDYVAGIANIVMRDKGKYSATTLMNMTHREPAWQEAWQTGQSYSFPDAPLSHETMKRYFSDILNVEMSSTVEDSLWNSIGREPSKEEWREIALSL